ncbi:zinc finger [Seminavis robusta]|uniref:Zinc finger n=1 Tax=Seminavis robusta TaxID=568900 RepID=A0A9N8EDV1_9STRA|nr:zinc finger [Seminavis robusta]|eukprot:Sro979_g227300.1 zinc finger (387) ;mRNA; r:31124-32284
METTNDTSNLLDLPEELLRKIFCDYLSAVSERHSLQCVNKRFQALTNSTKMKQALQILPPLVDASELTDADFDEECSDDSPPITSSFSCFLPEDTAMMAIQRYLPFAQVGNPDALYLLGLIATYVEDDIHTGLALFATSLDSTGAAQPQKQRLGRSQFELGLTLRRKRNFQELGEQIIQQTALAVGHPHALLATTECSRRSQHEELYKASENETAMTRNMIGLQFLLNKKPRPPRNVKLEFCGHPACPRRGYNTQVRYARHWVKSKGFTSGWENCRAEIMDSCATAGLANLPDAVQHGVYCVPSFCACIRCGRKLYCSRACQRLHWKDHRASCRQPRRMAAAFGRPQIVPQGPRAGQPGRRIPFQRLVREIADDFRHDLRFPGGPP